ncbi:MAG: hypothetical protein RTU92_05975 [Candidatus Thorarchaeota archaeon]
MKEKRFDELIQNGWTICQILFIAFAGIGLLLNNYDLISISVIFLLYIPFMVCAITVRGIGDKRKREKRKREREKRLRECKTLRCRSCDVIYEREELDISSKAIPRCPVCDKKLVPVD